MGRAARAVATRRSWANAAGEMWGTHSSSRLPRPGPAFPMATMDQQLELEACLGRWVAQSPRSPWPCFTLTDCPLSPCTCCRLYQVLFDAPGPSAQHRGAQCPAREPAHPPPASLSPCHEGRPSGECEAWELSWCCRRCQRPYMRVHVAGLQAIWRAPSNDTQTQTRSLVAGCKAA